MSDNEDAGAAAGRTNVLAEQLEKRRADRSYDDTRRLKERLETHTGSCMAISQSEAGVCDCESWVSGKHDDFYWAVCVKCAHTQHLHAVEAVEAEEEQ